MTVCIISIDHYLQYVEADTDSETLRASKERLRAIVVERLGTGTVGAIFEESSPATPSIAQELAEVGRISTYGLVRTCLREQPGLL
jgi:hypothetical protein